MEEHNPKELAIEAFKNYEFDMIYAMTLNKTEYSAVSMDGIVEEENGKKVFVCSFKTNDGETSISLPLDDRMDSHEEEIPYGATKAVFLLGSSDDGTMVMMRNGEEQSMWLDACIRFFRLLHITTWHDVRRLVEESYNISIEEAETEEDKSEAMLIKARSPFLKEMNSKVKDRVIPADEICDVMKEALDMHPYKIQGKPETYDNYSQGWTDAIYQIDAMLQLPDWEE